MRVDGAARAVVVFPDSDVKGADRTTDVGGRASFTFQAVHTVRREAMSGGRHGTVWESALFETARENSLIVKLVKTA